MVGAENSFGYLMHLWKVICIFLENTFVYIKYARKNDSKTFLNIVFRVLISFKEYQIIFDIYNIVLYTYT